jgi:hypothetical protein
MIDPTVLFPSGLSKGVTYLRQPPIFNSIFKTMEQIKTRSTYAEPELAKINYVDWLAIIRILCEQHGIHPVLCPDHISLLKGRP